MVAAANKMAEKILKIGARGSPLSLAQTGQVASLLEAANPGLKTEIIPIKTTGDKILDAPLAAIGGKGLFVKEIEEALLAKRVDLAIHSAKDLPAELPCGLTLGAVPQRADFRDVLICREPGGLAGLPQGAKVGTSGLRRRAQLLALRPDLQIEALRGNVGTRLEKIKTDFYATLLAAAGLARLGVTPPHSVWLDHETMLPAAGQGILALEVREGDEETAKILSPIHHRESAFALFCERGFLKELGSGCQLPIASLALIDNGTITLEGLIASLSGQKIVRDKWVRKIANTQEAASFGAELAQNLLGRGGREIMKELELL